MLSTGLSLRIPNRLGYNRIYQDTILPSASRRWTISGCFNHPALPWWSMALSENRLPWVTYGSYVILYDPMATHHVPPKTAIQWGLPISPHPVEPPGARKKMAENPTIWVSPNWGYLKKVSISIENKRHHQLWWPPIFRRTPIMLLALSHKYPLVSTITHS